MPDDPSHLACWSHQTPDVLPTTVPAKQFFVLGDDRDDSADSRFTTLFGDVWSEDMIATDGTIYRAKDLRRIFQPVR